MATCRAPQQGPAKSADQNTLPFPALERFSVFEGKRNKTRNKKWELQYLRPRGLVVVSLLARGWRVWSELEFVEITIIVVVVMVMVVVITCLLSHYKLSARSFIGRHSQGRRRDDALSSEGCLWPSDSTVSGSGIPEPQVYAPPRPTDRLAVPPFAQRDRFHRFQPTYPYLQHEIDLPPTISLSDGEEPPPYQGPCTLQLRDPEQQLELNRESVRAPPNRTIFDSDLMDSAMLGGPCPPSSNSGISATCYGGGGRMEGPPPTYSEVIGHYPGSAAFQHQQSSTPASLLEGARLHPAHLAALESAAAWSQEKEKQKGHPL
ncbi:Transmembrane prostate androgen-induced protein [Myotis brandtii]|uniref:Transmembrane prostate androgen-induced protein n=1 Tax=Myotis brandtii TaxID=109478 RepID=S7Q0A2_MYOBR|nr:Transmembrane prostate androgen-induced protein [Myotis brandtii]